MPAHRRTRPTAVTRAAWTVQAALAYHAGRISADQYRQVIQQHRRHADTTQVLDHSDPMRTV